jgi:hypothetical protein
VGNANGDCRRRRRRICLGRVFAVIRLVSVAFLLKPSHIWTGALLLHQWESISLGAPVTGVLCSDYIHSTVRAAKRTSSERRDTEWNRGERVLCRGGGCVDPGFFFFFLGFLDA